MTRRTLLFSQAALAAGEPFFAGAAKRLITPSPLLPISGGMGMPTPATARQGELTARALVLRSGGESIAIVSIDVLGFPSVLGNQVRTLVPRLAPERIVIGATHTHSAPDCYAFPDGKGGHTASLPYLRFVVEQAAAAVNGALDHMREAEFRAAAGEAKGKIAYNYYAPDLYDRRAGILQVRTVEGEAIATLVNYAIHPEVLGSAQGILSPDLVGPLTDRLEQTAGGVALFLNGAQGGMITADNREYEKPRDPARAYWRDSRTWAECERIGGLLASESLRIIEPAAWSRRVPITNRAATVRFSVDSDILWQVVQHSPLQYPHGPGRTVATQVNAITIGDARILTIPGEALPNIGFYLKRKMGGKHQFLFGLTNDAFGYMMTAVDFQSFPAYGYISRVSLGEGTGDLYIREALRLFD
ncbi:MAG: hypothetical protein FJW30_10825 [Acidobacteria bacterium]|nr:hypothetical protein [Acidobacteriota bacterium]